MKNNKKINKRENTNSERKNIMYIERGKKDGKFTLLFTYRVRIQCGIKVMEKLLNKMS